ncbi:MAG: CotH kinase family protein [Actinobacteria bacterium]|nr:CotH kinase family protein [Actinomycetota bacterium]
MNPPTIDHRPDPGPIPRRRDRRRRYRRPAVAAVTALMILSSCSADADTDAASADTGSNDTGAVAGNTTLVSDSDSLFDETGVHTIEVTFDEDDYAQLIDDYETTGDKTWIESTVTIDGTTYERVGLRLKGNSSLRSVDDTSAPEDLPWLIDLDEFVDGQDHDGVDELVVRANKSATALNEAVALDLLEAAGLASQQAVSARFSVNGSDEVLRLVIEHPDGSWVDDWFGTDGSLYKAESSGDYSYRGDDAASYEDVFDLEAGDDESLTYLTDFLAFVDESDDETFAAELDQHLDVDGFATYLAMMELLGNSDDIDGPGNNSYLYHDPETGLMSVVPWDMNLALGVGMGGGGGGGRGGGGGVGGGRGFGGGANVLVERFLEVDEFSAAYDDALTELRYELVDSGLADDLLAERVAILQAQASDLVPSDTVIAEADAVAQALS